MKKPRYSGTRMERVEGIRFADPQSAIYSTRLFVGSRHLGPMPGPEKVSRRKQVLKRMTEQAGREAIAAIEGDLRDNENASIRKNTTVRVEN